MTAMLLLLTQLAATPCTEAQSECHAACERTVQPVPPTLGVNDWFRATDLARRVDECTAKCSEPAPEQQGSAMGPHQGDATPK